MRKVEDIKGMEEELHLFELWKKTGLTHKMILSSRELALVVSSPLASSGAKSLRSGKLFAFISDLTVVVFCEGG